MVEAINYLRSAAAAVVRPRPPRPARGHVAGQRRPREALVRVAPRAAPAAPALDGIVERVARARRRARASSSGSTSQPVSPSSTMSAGPKRSTAIGGQAARHPLDEHRAELLAHRGQHDDVGAPTGTSAARRGRASRRGRRCARPSRLIASDGCSPSHSPGIAAEQDERRRLGEPPALGARERAHEQRAARLTAVKRPTASSTGPLRERARSRPRCRRPTPSSPPGRQPRGSSTRWLAPVGGAVDRMRRRSARGRSRWGDARSGRDRRRSRSRRAVDLVRREHEQPLAALRPAAHPPRPRVGVRPVGGAVDDLLEHQQLGAVQVADDRDVGRDARGRLVQRREVVQVQDVALRRRPLARARAAPGGDVRARSASSSTAAKTGSGAPGRSS